MRKVNDREKAIFYAEISMELSLGKLKHIDPRTLWKNEAGDFTPWLADNLPLLGEALGLDLQLDQTEGQLAISRATSWPGRSERTAR